MKHTVMALGMIALTSLSLASDTQNLLKAKLVANTKRAGVNKVLGSQSLRHQLAMHRLYQVADCEQFDKFIASDAGKEFLGRFTKDYAWMITTLCQGVPVVRNNSHEGKDLNNRYSEALIRMAIIAKKYPMIWRNEKLKEVAATIAFSTPFRNYDRAFTLRSFGYFFESMQNKELIPQFYEYEPWLLRYVTWHGETSRWLQTRYSVPPQQLHGMAWNVHYRLWNIFDDSIHSHSYAEPWDGVTGEFQVNVDVGGVCGAISKVGSLTANSHGAPCITMGQPGHCAYAYYDFAKNTWYRSNDVSRPSYPHHVILEHAFHGFTELQLAVDTFQPYDQYIKAAHVNWLGHLLASDNQNQLAERCLAMSVQQKPKAFDFRNDYLQFLCKKERIEKGQIINELKSAVTAFIAYPDQAWQLIQNAQPLFDKLSPTEKFTFIEFFHQQASQQKMDSHVMYTSLINHQFTQVDNKKQIIDLINKYYKTDKTPAKWDLDEILNPKEKK